LVEDGYLGDTWRKIDNALRHGLRGLPGGSSVALLLVAARGVRSPQYLPDLAEETILGWADRHRERMSRLPNEDSGLVEGDAGEDWYNIDAALRKGPRGLPGGSSLAYLLEQGRNVPNRLSIPNLPVEMIWAGRTHTAPDPASAPRVAV
jgi:hypothetical protein